MNFTFFKYQGTGNDFIIFDDRDGSFPVSESLIIHLCDRKFGVGSDGLILIQESEDYDFHMEFYNPDASQSFCGNGSRCAVAFAHRLGIIEETCTFSAIDGVHKAKVVENEQVEVSMRDVSAITKYENDLILDTGSPHYVRFTKHLEKEDIIETGRSIRYSDRFKNEGINVNLVQVLDDNSLECATYERGVENETLSCGTGVTAMALGANKAYDLPSPIRVLTKGGELEVSFSQNEENYTHVFLKGPAQFVFRGDIQL
jgi:diaminopimelate epimerase